MAAKGEKLFKEDPFKGTNFLPGGGHGVLTTPTVSEGDADGGKDTKEKEPKRTVTILNEQEIADLKEQQEKQSKEKTEGGEKPTEDKDKEKTQAADTETDEGKEKEGKGPSDEESKSPNPIYLHAAVLHERGALPNVDLDELKGKFEEMSEEEQVEAVIDASENEIRLRVEEGIKKGVSDYKSMFNENQLEVLKLYEKGVKFETAMKAVIDELRYNSVKPGDLEEDEGLQENVIREALRLQGYRATSIDNKINRAKEGEFLIDDAKESLDFLIDYGKKQKQKADSDAVKLEEQRKEREKQEKKNNEKLIEDIKSHVEGTKEIIPGLSVTKREQQKIIQMMTIPVDFREYQGQKYPVDQKTILREKDPIHFETLLNYYISIGLFDKKPNFDKILEKGESSATKELAKVLKKGAEEKSESGKPVVKEKKGPEESKGLPKNYFPFRTK